MIFPSCPSKWWGGGRARQGWAGAGATGLPEPSPPSLPPPLPLVAGCAAPQTLATLAADPIAGLISTAWVGRLGPPELAAVGVALSVFNTSTKLFNMPLLSVTTSTVASALGEEKGGPGEAGRVDWHAGRLACSRAGPALPGSRAQSA